MAVKYGEFEFPSERGFTGSAGKTLVKAHYRQGGEVKATPQQQERMTRNAQRAPEDSVRDVRRSIPARPAPLSGLGAVSDPDRQAKLDRNAKLGLARGGCVAKKNPQKIGSQQPVIKKGLGGIVKAVAPALFGVAGAALAKGIGGKKDDDKSPAQQMTEDQRAKMTGNA